MKKQQDAISKLRSKGLISTSPSKWLEKAKRRAEEEPWKRRSQAVALLIMRTLRDKKMSQKELAEKLSVSPQQVNKWVKGNENFTFETVTKLEAALGIELMQIKGLKDKPTNNEGNYRVEIAYIRRRSYEFAMAPSSETKVVSINGEYVEEDSYTLDEQYA